MSLNESSDVSASSAGGRGNSRCELRVVLVVLVVVAFGVAGDLVLAATCDLVVSFGGRRACDCADAAGGGGVDVAVRPLEDRARDGERARDGAAGRDPD